MALLRERQVRQAAVRAKGIRAFATAQTILKEQKDPREQHYDVFLCHAVKDADLVLGAKQILVERNFSVYVDWIEDPQLDRSNVNRNTANVLRGRMTCCDSLLYLHTRYSPSSKWMPWELGFFDGHNGNVGILPVIKDTDNEAFIGQEYLSLYPYVDVAVASNGIEVVKVNASNREYLPLRQWKAGNHVWHRAF